MRMASLLSRVFLLLSLLVVGSDGFAPPGAVSSRGVRRRHHLPQSAPSYRKQVQQGPQSCRSLLGPLLPQLLVPASTLGWSSRPLEPQTKHHARSLLIPESLCNRRRPFSSAPAASRQETHHGGSEAHHFWSSLNVLQRLRTRTAKSGSSYSPEAKTPGKQWRQKKVVVGLLVIATSTVLASVSSDNFSRHCRSLLKTGWTWMAHHYKRCLGAAGLAALVVAGQDLVRTRRRQAVDPTSEWSRYARHPILRGLALFTIAAQVTVLALLGRQRRLFPAMQARAGGCLADGLLKVGPLYIKLGQIVSSKSGLLPKAWTPALERLQDQVPAQSGEKAAALAYAAWPGGRASFDATFESVDWTPLAAASLGQVHRATLRNNHRGRAPFSASTTATAATTGSSSSSSTEQAHKEPQEVVALKLQRPFLREIYDQDFAFLMYIAQTVDRFLEKSAGSIGGVQQSWEHIFRNAETILYREIDYVAEADNMMRFNRDFGLGKGGSSSSRPDRPCTALARNGKPLASASSWLRSPHVYAELSSEKVLVMEYVPSIKVTKSDELDRAGLTVRDKEYLAECLGRSYLRQLCCHKFFSTDPHAGNLGVETLDMASTLPDKRVRLCFYDFGQVAELKQNQADGILEILEAIIDSDVDRSVRAFQQMGVLKDGADLDVVRAKVADNYRTGKIKAKSRKKNGQKCPISQHDIMAPSNDYEGSKSNHSSSDAHVMKYFALPAEYAFVGRALTQMDGVGKSLDPDFDFVSAAAPWFYEIKGADMYLMDEAAKKLGDLKVKLFGAWNSAPTTLDFY